MLIDLDTGRTITKMPRAAQYRLWVSRLTPGELVAAKDAINTMIDEDEIHTAGWMPGNDWSGTAFEPLYTKAALKDRTASGLCFGLLVWEVFAQRPDYWASGRYEKDGAPIGSRTYFRLRDFRAADEA